MLEHRIPLKTTFEDGSRHNHGEAERTFPTRVGYEEERLVRRADDTVWTLDALVGRAVSISSSSLFSVFVFPLGYAGVFSVVPFWLCLYFPYHPYLFLRD